ncbi:MAG: hypothetical protein ACOYN0_18680 [Phycisphaerales bacterium]
MNALAIFLSLLLTHFGVAAVAQPPQPEAAVEFAPRLAALKPDEPAKYLELAEEVLDRYPDAESRRLAVELYVLAYCLDVSGGGSRQVAKSACIGLAATPGHARYESWLRALAGEMTPAARGGPVAKQPGPSSADSPAYRAALVLGYVRSGEGGLARQLLAKPEVAGVFSAIDRLLAQLGVATGAEGLARAADVWPCTACGNERLQRRPQSTPAVWKLCPQCGGLPGGTLPPAELIGHLRAESYLLEGVQRSWAAQITTDQGAPLMDPLSESLPRVFAVDPTRTLYRNGTWVRSGN